MRRNIPVEKNNIYTVEIENVSSDGNGIGHIHGFTVFVPGAVGGDVVRVRIKKIKSGYCYGETESLTVQSPDREEPPCACYLECGGCSLMHINYEKQLEIKKGVIINALKRIGGFEKVPYEEMIGSKRFRYRNKMIFRFGEGPVCGFYKEKSHEVVGVEDCLTGDEINGGIIKAALEHIRENGISVYDEKTHTGLMRSIFTRTSRSDGSVMVVITVNGTSVPAAGTLVKKLRSVSKRITGILLNVNQKKTNIALGERNILLWGKDAVCDTLLGVRYEISPQSFFQINPESAEKLYERAIEYAKLTPDTEVIDIYCGIGTISLSAAQTAKKVTGIEIVPRAIENAKANAEANGICNTEFFAADAALKVPELVEAGMRPQVVILDPPRRGSDEAVLEAILKASPDRIVYVSCNPSTLARDAKYLAQGGYALDRVTGVDMFPNTNHVETVCQLVLRRSPVHINIDVDVEELVQDKRGTATYEQIKEYVLEHSGLKVSNLYIAQVKQKCGIIERENYNKPKSEDSKQPLCPPEKEVAIKDALKHFGMI